jgi:hypothetical protein
MSTVILDWRHGTTGEPEPCIICGQPAICRSPAKNVPCHKRCAETWIAAHARDAGHRDQLIRQHTP